MRSEVTLSLNALEDGMKGKREHDGASRVSLLRFLMASQPLATEVQVRLACFLQSVREPDERG